MYKKVNLKFSYEKFSHENRVQQTQKTRESSRFKRLSAIRNLENSDVLHDENEHQKVANPTEKRPMSRLEMLKIWREDQQKRREEEMKKKPPPFYVGKAATRKPVFNKADSKIFPKGTSANSTPSGIKTTKTVSFQKPANQIVKTFTKSEKAAPVTTSSKTAQQKSSFGFKPRSYADSKILPKSTSANSVPSGVKTTKMGSLQKPANQISHQLKPTSVVPSKPALKPPVQTLKTMPTSKSKQKLTEVPRSVSGISKEIPVVKVQSKIQAPLTSRQPGIGIPKFSAKPCVKTPVNRTQTKGPSISAEGCQKGKLAGGPNKISGNPKKADEKVKVSEKVEACEVTDNMELTFNSDISIIKPSFAPANFLFKPPAELLHFSMSADNDEDDDPFVVMEKMKKYFRRTSTPEKLAGINSSSEKRSATPEKLLETCPNDNVEISDLVNTVTQPLKDENIMNIVTDESLNTADSNVEISDLISTTLLPLDQIIPKDINDKPLKHDVPTTTETTVTDIFKLSANFPSEEETISNINGNNVVKEDTVVAAVEKLNHETLCAVPETAEKERVKSNDIGAVKDNSVETASYIDNCVTPCDATVKTLKNASTDKVLLDDSLGIIDLKNIVEAASKTGTNEAQCNAVADSDENDTPCNNSPFNDSLGIINLNIESPLLEPVNLMKLEDEVVFKVSDDTTEPVIVKPMVSKPVGAIPKRTSFLKSISTLEAISEVSEFENSKERLRCIDLSPKQNATPRRSKRLSERKFIKDVVSDVESPQQCSSFTPRRSTRLQKAATPKFYKTEDCVSSPFVPRRSMRLIDLNTPERKEGLKTDLTLPFEKLTLNDSENMNPQALLENLESPDVNQSKKVSLLYTPEKKRRSMRKSIRGDLMSFSPA